MTNENQKKNSLKKYKFLVPQIVNLAFIFFVCSVARVDGNLVVGLTMFSILATMVSIHLYKMERDERYKKTEIEAKKVPWNKRTSSYQIRTGLEDLSLISYICVAFFIFGIFRSIYHHEYTNALALLLFGSFVFVLTKIIGKILKKFFSK